MGQTLKFHIYVSKICHCVKKKHKLWIDGSFIKYLNNFKRWSTAFKECFTTNIPINICSF